MHNEFWKKIGLFLAMIGIMFGLMVFREENEYDKEFVKLKLVPQQTVEYNVDLSKEGILKRYLQPEKYTLYLRLRGASKNEPLYCRTEGVKMFVSQGSKKGIWHELQADKPVATYKNIIPLSVEFVLPKDKLLQGEQCQGKIVLYNAKGVYSTVLINFKM